MSRRRSGPSAAVANQVHNARTMLWLGRRLWRPVAADLARIEGGAARRCSAPAGRAPCSGVVD